MRSHKTIFAALMVLSPAILPAQNPTEFNAVFARYGQINTIAGSGALDECNDWLPAYEGGPAVNADLSRPHMASADAAGNVYVADKESYAVRKIDLDGRIHTVAGTGTFGDSTGSQIATQTDLWGPNGLFVFPDGTLYFLTVNDNCETGVVLPGGKVHRVNLDGTITTILEDPALTVGRGLYVTRDQATIIYCSGDRIKKWSSATGIQDFATGFGQLGNLDREASGSFLVADRGLNRVYRVTADGSTTTPVAGSTSSSATGGTGAPATSVWLEEVRGVAVLDTGGYFVCTHRGSQVWYVDTSNRIWLFIDGHRSDDTHAGDGLPLSVPGLKISEPRDIHIAPNGDLLITENDNGYIRRVTNISIKPRLVNLDHNPSSGFHLSWTSHREGSYLVRKTTNFIDWTPSAPIPGTNGRLTSYTDPQATTNPQTFYQVVEE